MLYAGRSADGSHLLVSISGEDGGGQNIHSSSADGIHLLVDIYISWGGAVGEQCLF